MAFSMDRDDEEILTHSFHIGTKMILIELFGFRKEINFDEMRRIGKKKIGLRLDAELLMSELTI